MRYIRVALYVAVILTATAAQSRTWRVEVDGSADFTNIQPAVEAAVDGDSILIGAGRFSQTFLYHAPGWSDQVVVGINNKDLTLIGSGQNVTFIGPAARDALLWPGPIGIMVDLDCDVRIEALTTENIRCGIYFWSDHLEIDRCSFYNHDIAISSWGVNGTIINDSLFIGNEIGIWSSSRGYGMIVTNCEFIGYSTFHISLKDVESTLIQHCNFTNAAVAIQFDGSSCYGNIIECQVLSGTGPHFASVSHAQMEITDNRLHGGNKQLFVGSGTIIGHGNVLYGTDYTGGGFATIYCVGGYLELNNNHIMRGNAQYLVLAEYYIQPETIVLNLKNNWWGAADSDSLALWMHDINDDPSNHVVIDYSPYYGGPIANEDMSFGEIKAMFRR